MVIGFAVGQACADAGPLAANGRRPSKAAEIPYTSFIENRARARSVSVLPFVIAA
jgi:hypothetical protein